MHKLQKCSKISIYPVFVVFTLSFIVLFCASFLTDIEFTGKKPAKISALDKLQFEEKPPLPKGRWAARVRLGGIRRKMFPISPHFGRIRNYLP